MKICKSIFWFFAVAKPEDATVLGDSYRTLDQTSPSGSTFPAQFGMRFQF